MAESTYERCIECDSPTGRAGWGEDSLYIGDCGPYCEECFELMPEVFAVEAANQKIIAKRLKEKNSVLTEALVRIANMTAGGPHPSPIEGMGAALASLDCARDIANDALTRASADSEGSEQKIAQAPGWTGPPVTDECYNCGGTKAAGTCTCTSDVPWPSSTSQG